MELQSLVGPLLKWINLNNPSDKSPGVSYIETKILNYSATRAIVEHLEPFEILKLCYILYFVNEGDSFEVAKEKSEQLKYVDSMQVKNISPHLETCDECYGNGDIDCEECDGEGEVECTYCDGEGEFEGRDGEMETCDVCDGSGRETCNECYGDTTISCENCGGDGEVETDYEEIEYENNYFIFYSPTIYEKLENLKEKQNYNETDVEEILDSEGSGDILYLSFKSDVMSREDFARSVDMNPDDIEDGEEYIYDYGNGIPPLKLEGNPSIGQGFKLRV